MQLAVYQFVVDSVMQIGSEASIERSECEAFSVSVLAKTAIGNEIELGWGEVPFSSVLGPQEGQQSPGLINGADIWIDLRHRRSGRLIGRLLLKAGQVPIMPAEAQSSSSNVKL